MKPVAARLPGIFVLAAIVIGVASAPASADLVRWHLPGVIDGSSNCSEDFPDPDCEAYRELLLQSFPVGTHVDFDLVIDTHDFCSEPDLGLYSITKFNVTINGATGTSLQEDAGVVEVPHNFGCFHDLHSGVMYVVGTLNNGPLFDLFNTVEMFFNVAPGDDLPTTLVSGGFFLERFNTERALGGPVGPLSVVPEPTTAVLVLSGLVAAVARRRRLVGRHRR